jgi:fatty-acyl-CoA synthase
MTVGGVLHTSAAKFPSREAIYCVSTGRRVSYAQLNKRSNQLANYLLGLMLPKGSVVAFLASNRLEIIECYFAVAKAGFVGLPLNYRLAPREIEVLIRTMGAAVLICEEKFAPTFEYLKAASATTRHVLWIGTANQHGCVQYETALAQSSCAELRVDVNEADTFYLNLTSGTTGLPKSYALSHYNLVTMEPTVSAFDLSSSDVFLNVFPVFGRIGFGTSLSSVLLGARNVLMDFDAGEVLKVIQREKVTFINVVPTMAALLLKRLELEPELVASLRAIVFIGAMLPAAIRDEAISRLCRSIYEGYGLQESGLLTVSTPEDRAIKPESIGRPVMFADVRIVDALGNEVPTGEIGEIIGRSPHCTTAYVDSPQKNSEVFRDGWFHTGDLGRQDADGYFYISGRVKDMIISGGQNIHAAEVEAALLGIEGVQDCAVFGLPDETWGECVAASIVTSDPSLTAERLQAACREVLAGFKLPRKLFFQSEALPRTPTGKVQKFLLVERHAGKSPACEAAERSP